jgi:hypothetical protein
VAFVAAVGLLRRAHWRQVASALYAQNIAGWQAQRAWTAVASRDPEPWRATAAETARRALEGLGLSFAGWIQNATFPLGAIQPTQIGMSIFFGDEGTIWAASYQAADHEVVEFESEFADGSVLSTGNNELAARLALPRSFDVCQQPFDSDPSALLTLHRDRIAARLGARPEVPLVRCATLEDVLASQDRQRAVKQPFRLHDGRRVRTCRPSLTAVTRRHEGHLRRISTRRPQGPRGGRCTFRRRRVAG